MCIRDRTWTIQAAAGAEGDVSFQVQLQPSTTGTVTNTAQVQVGNDPAVDVEACLLYTSRCV